MNTAFTDDGWDDYTYWLTNDRKVLAKINALIKDIKRSPYQGIGKPERLRHMEDNVWSRRITHEHRLVYVIVDDTVVIQQARYHYD
ncbi:Txe/YoeB family addiction module toxin [Rhodococcus sp. ACS1]|uniref:Endoribonuclease YoeB n=1 Tax=Rhodococcus koreensis TaxID=99653 RepID=A0A1H4XST6_9NOCA|nr:MULTISPECIES: Txe/YoeB family addiction module toxin [Rhodococcus]PBC48384.1 Txe/YoeB family addiction module toxin [Rhodococcus sp. ACS1]QSE80134.1 Txe/YoeB family addiction module toxin [Rhodococcus koreensis]SED08713.1 toxin YoeB [Rhodococcus koreensis]